MCGIAGCYQQADGRKLTDIMTVLIAHRGPDAYGDGRSGELFLARDPLGIRASALEHLIADERAGRQDNVKQIWQLLTMEPRYRNARSIGVTA
jgi:hypothetical protein